MRGRSVVSLFVLAAGALLAPPSTALEEPSPTNAYAYLTWNSGQGAISWTSAASTEDGVGPSGMLERDVKARVGWMARGWTDGAAGKDLISVYSFESAPAPRTLYLNVTQPIILCLYYTYHVVDAGGYKFGTVGYNFEVELLLDGKRVAGALDATTQKGPGPYTRLLAPMLPEVRSIPQGAKLTLHLYDRGRDGHDLTFGFKDDHRSTLNFTTWPPEEILFRSRTPFLKSGDAGATGSGNATPALTPLVGLVAGVAGRRRALAVACIALLLPTSGCFAKEAAPQSTQSTAPTGQGTVNVHTDRDPGNLTGIANTSKATLIGNVGDELGLPVVGANVTLLGYGFSAFRTTDKYGRFTFLNLTPGQYEVTARKEKYATAGRLFDVPGGRVTDLEIVMPYTGSDGGFRPHAHPWWTTPVEKVLDTTVTMEAQLFGVTTPRYCFGYVAPQYWCQQDVPFPDQLPNGLSNIIRPGTEQVEVKISWPTTTPSGVERMGVNFFAPGLEQQYAMYPRGNGETTTLQTSWEMTDHGHQKNTVWQFWITFPEYGGGTFEVPLVQPRVEMWIRKGVLPLEDPHIDYWKANDTLLLVDASGVYRPGLTSCWLPGRCTGGSSYAIPPLPGVVPSETQWIEFRLVQKTATNQHYYPVFRHADMPADAPQSAWPAPTLVTSNGTHITYRQDVAPQWPDAIYSKASRWRFQLALDVDYAAYAQDGVNALASNPMSLVILAHKGPKPAS